MVVVSYSGREINAKIVYYGPGLSGKTTNLEKIYDSVPESNRGRMVSMKTQTDRTLSSTCSLWIWASSPG